MPNCHLWSFHGDQPLLERPPVVVQVSYYGNGKQREELTKVTLSEMLSHMFHVWWLKSQTLVQHMSFNLSVVTRLITRLDPLQLCMTSKIFSHHSP